MITCVASPPVQFLTRATGLHCFAGCIVPFPVRQNIPLRTYVSCRFRRIRELAEHFVPNADSTALDGAIMRAKEGFSMAHFTLCFILLAAALGHAIQPPANLDQSAPTSNLAVLGSHMAAASGQVPMAATASPNDIALAANNEGTCYKIRAYIFKRDDDHAPQFVRSTTCGPGQPHTKDAVWPKPRMVPAD